MKAKMNRSALLISVLFGMVVISGSVVGQEKRDHKCVQVLPGSRGVIKEAGSVKPAKCLKQELPTAAALPDSTPVSASPLRYEVLINEQGQVECVEWLERGQGAEAIAAIYEPYIKKWLFEPPKDDAGNPVSCYQIVLVHLVFGSK
jgi:hypothetical protein